VEVTYISFSHFNVPLPFYVKQLFSRGIASADGCSVKSDYKSVVINV
jgi:hypothetical protein